MSRDTETDLDRLYSPSRWSLRYPTYEEVLAHHVESVTAASEAAMENIPNELDIKYGSTSKQKIDIFGIDLSNDAPIFVYVHGGYWQELSKEQSRYPAQPLYRSQIKTIVVGYELCPAVTLADILHQIEDAVKFIFEYARNNGSRGIYFAGHSAGAHLLAMVFSNPQLLDIVPCLDLLRGMFLISGIYDLQDLVKTSINDAVKLPPDSAASFSPLLKSYQHLRISKVRIYIIAAENDSPAFKKQSENFYKHLGKHYLPDSTYLYIKDNYDHFDLVEVLSDDNNYLKQLLLEDLQK